MENLQHGNWSIWVFALAIGLLIGTERGWERRTAQEGSRIAGIRTFHRQDAEKL